jgi:hypothetical protein
MFNFEPKYEIEDEIEEEEYCFYDLDEDEK